MCASVRARVLPTFVCRWGMIRCCVPSRRQPTSTHRNVAYLFTVCGMSPYRRMPAACCLLHVCCPLSAVMLSAVRCLLHVVCRMLSAVMLSAVRCLLHVVCRMLSVACCLLHVVCCHVVCCMLSHCCLSAVRCLSSVGLVLCSHSPARKRVGLDMIRSLLQ
jgi:hypothetical protein